MDLGREKVKKNNGKILTLFSKEHFGLASKFEVDPSSCGNPGYYKDYLMHSALSDNKSGKSTTHIILDTNTSAIAGFITLKATALLTEMDHNLFSGEPALEIYNLAVAKDYQRQGIGTELVCLAIYITKSLNESFVGIRNIVLTADKKAVGFYEKLEFQKLSDYYILPKDRQNKSCVPMVMKIYT